MQSEAGPHAQRKPVITCKHMQAQLKAAISPPAHLLQCRVIPKDTASPAHPCRLSLLARLALLHHLCAQPLQPPLAALSLDGGGHLQDCCGKRAMSFDHDANQRSPPAAAAPPPAMPAQVEEGGAGQAWEPATALLHALQLAGAACATAHQQARLGVSNTLAAGRLPATPPCPSGQHPAPPGAPPPGPPAAAAPPLGVMQRPVQGESRAGRWAWAPPAAACSLMRHATPSALLDRAASTAQRPTHQQSTVTPPSPPPSHLRLCKCLLLVRQLLLQPLRLLCPLPLQGG